MIDDTKFFLIYCISCHKYDYGLKKKLFKRHKDHNGFITTSLIIHQIVD
jgi:hypothetical protein